jgi:hypothetical protein
MRSGTSGVRVGVGASGGEGMASVGWERSGGAKVFAHSATSVTEEVCVAPPNEVYRRAGTRLAWR